MIDRDALNAVDLQTISTMPVTAYCRGWEDAVYQNIYYNPYGKDTPEWKAYDEGHEEGTWERCALANAR